MNDAQTEKNKKDFYKLGIYQIVGGAVGFLMILWSFVNAVDFNWISLIICIIIFLFFSFSIFCGLYCIKQKEIALRLSFINQFIQVFGFALLGFSFKYIAGFYFNIGINFSDDFNFTTSLGISKFDFTINKEPERLEVDINIVAIVILNWIGKIKAKVKAANETAQVASIGEI
jgi:hypothetical protein